MTAQSETCTWTEDDEGTWETDCGEQYGFIEGGPKENRANFCQYCGKPLVERPYTESEDE